MPVIGLFFYVYLDPAAPTNVTITEITCETATVVWDVVDNAIGYRVDYELQLISSSTAYSESHIVIDSDVPNSCTIEQLESSSEYLVTVTSLSDNGGTSSPVTFTTHSNCDNSSNMNGNYIGRLMHVAIYSSSYVYIAIYLMIYIIYIYIEL